MRPVVDEPDTSSLAGIRVAVVIPAYQAELTIRPVVEAIPAWIEAIVIVADGCRDATRAVVEDIQHQQRRVILVVHETNQGVGAAMRTGYGRALEEGADILVKMDSDGQMDPAYLPHLVLPLAAGVADYAKGNRFLHPDALRRMPLGRLFGNAVLSFASKLSSGYWNVLDPTNGYTGISREALAAIDLAHLDDGYFFESSMLNELALVRAVVTDVAMPARYGNEQSHLSVAWSVPAFARRHLRQFARRIVHRYLLTDFSPVSLLVAVSIPLLLFGLTVGAWSWMRSILHGVPATAGTVMLAALPVAAGAYGLVQAMVYDILAVPQRPLTPPRLRVHRLTDYARRGT